MNANKTLLGIVVIAILVLVLYQANQTKQLKEVVISVGKDRDDLQKKVTDLSRRVGNDNAPSPDSPTPAPVDAPTAPAPAAPVVQAAEPAPGVTIKAPAGWMKNGSKTDAYVVGVDQNVTFDGTPSAYVKSTQPNVDGFGGMMQTISAEEYAGKRIRYSGMVKAADANDGGGHLWLRIDPQQGTAPLGFDNMDNRPVKGSTDWVPASVVLDVPANARAIAFGMFVAGTGQMWSSGVKIEEVGPDVPVTNMMPAPGAPAAPPPQKTPQNLGFE